MNLALTWLFPVNQPQSCVQTLRFSQRSSALPPKLLQPAVEWCVHTWQKPAKRQRKRRPQSTGLARAGAALCGCMAVNAKDWGPVGVARGL